MSDIIKKEFKDFITDLSSEICKQVLFEELKEINLSFKEICESYTLNIKKVIDETKNLETINKEANNFVKVISYNSNKVDEALNLIEGGNVQVINQIMSKNDALFKEYNTKVHLLNQAEKEDFINSLSSCMEKQSKKYLLELKNILNTSDMKKAYEDIQNFLEKIDTLNSQVFSIKNGISNAEKNFTEQNINNKNWLNNKFDEVNEVYISMYSKLETLHLQSINEMVELKDKIDKKNNIIIILSSILLVFCTILILK